MKTLVLERKWAKILFEKCKSKQIMPPEKATRDFAVIEIVFSRTDALQVMADSTGKKANLHPLSLELWDTCHKVLCEQAHFNTFQGAEAMNKNLHNTVQIEALQNLCVPSIENQWTDAHAQFVGQGKIDSDHDENEEKKASHIQLPTRSEAIKPAAKNELQLFHGTSFVKSGDVAQDRERMFRSCLLYPSPSTRDATLAPMTYYA